VTRPPRQAQKNHRLGTGLMVSREDGTGITVADGGGRRGARRQSVAGEQSRERGAAERQARKP
jgi:hypothetical protein